MKISNLLPGPVSIPSFVEAAFKQPYISHRTESFAEMYNDTKHLLTSLLKTRYVQLLMGSGSLANEVVAGQLSLLPDKGLILTNGEFGERLVRQASRWNMDFAVLDLPWATAFELSEIEAILKKEKITWLWMVCCETSTGMLNPICDITDLCEQYGTKLCVDSISAAGTIPLDLSRVYLASAVSSKGLMSYAGIAIVLHNHPVTSSCRLPSYLDLGIYAEKSHTPYTFSSNLLSALHSSLTNNIFEKRFEKIQQLNLLIRKELRTLRLSVMVNEPHASPAVITITLPERISGNVLAKKLWEQGVWLSHESEYLLKRNMVQACLMGDVEESDVKLFLDVLRKEIIAQEEPVNA